MTAAPSALQFSVDGAENGGVDPEQTVVLVHGFPDSPALWAQTSAHLSARGYRVIRIALPGFEDDTSSPVSITFDDTVDRLYATLSATGSLGATLVGHDWGAIFLYLLLRRYPDAAGKLVTLEVGAGPRSPALALFVLVYHALLNLAHWLGAGLGDRLMGWLCRRFLRPDYPHALLPKARHGWLYRQAWREGGRDGAWPFYFRNGIDAWTPPPALPFLFLFGQDGPRALRFHTERWRREVTAHCPDSRSHALPGGHWCLLEHPEAFHEALDTFLEPGA